MPKKLPKKLLLIPAVWLASACTHYKQAAVVNMAPVLTSINIVRPQWFNRDHQQS